MKLLKKIKENSAEIKKRIISGLKFMIFSVTTVMGFWLIYAMIYFSIGLPETKLGLWILFGLAALSEWLFAKWLNI